VKVAEATLPQSVASRPTLSLSVEEAREFETRREREQDRRFVELKAEREFQAKQTEMMLSMMTPVLIAMVSVFIALLYFRNQEKNRREDLELRRQELEISRHSLKAPERSGSEDEQESTRAATTGSGGYIVLDLPDDQKAMFQDVLKGFEEFARLKGYSISFSVDGSVTDKIAFKFTILDQGVTVSTRKVQDDLQEYLARVQRGDDLDDMEVVIPDPQHAALILALKARISYLKQTYGWQKTGIEFYERILKTADGRGSGILPAQTFYLQAPGGTMTADSKSYTAINSERIVQGEANEVDQSVHIAESFNEKKQQVDNLEQLIAALTTAHPTPTDASKKAIINLEKVKDEISNEAKPSGSSVKKWLESAKDAIKALALGKDALDLAKKTFDGFQLPF
jgi:hypothetical protein